MAPLAALNFLRHIIYQESYFKAASGAWDIAFGILFTCFPIDLWLDNLNNVNSWHNQPDYLIHWLVSHW